VSHHAAGPALPYRLPTGGLIDRSRTLRASFDWVPLTGFAGDTLASALLAAGQRLIARSFKYHRPRGVLTAGSEEANALVELRAGARREPNTKATTIELFEGLTARSQNRWPSLRFDLQAAASCLSPMFAAGFYYKTFMWPAQFWELVYEPLIRRAAGLGRAAELADPDRYEQAFAFCDVLVIGAGPAGLMAALSAARAGARVILCDEDFRPGGRLLADRHEIAGTESVAWVATVLDELKSYPELRVLPRTTVFGVYDGGVYGALERVADHLPVPPEFAPRQRMWRIIAKRAVLAAGAVERGIVFGSNDRPGIMMASAMRTYLNRFAVSPGRRVAIFTNNNDGWRTAEDLTRAGVEVAALIDSRSATPNAAHPAPARVIVGGEVISTSGRSSLRSVTVRKNGKTETIRVDALGVSGGYNPNVNLACHHGSRPIWDAGLAAFVPGPPPPGLVVVGAAAGTLSLGRCLASGAQAGHRAAKEAGFSASPIELPKTDDEPIALTPLWHVTKSSGKAFVDFQNDVTVSDIALAVKEGFGAVEHLKRYTTLGMGTDQGKTANVNGLAILAALTGRSIVATGLTGFRPPYSPVAIGAFAGRHRAKHFRPTRRTPSHDFATAQGAVFIEAGAWLRAQYYHLSGQASALETISREVANVRSAVGFCDVSTLGKIDVHGADAGSFLDKLYINSFASLKVGRARYGVMLREDGFVLDDGTISRFSQDHFFMTTTTANAARVFQHMQFCHQVLWPKLDVGFVSVTDQWAQFSIAGPRARDTLAALVDQQAEVSPEALPYMGVTQTTVCDGVPARLYRLSFSGELAYEIGVPARFGNSLARALMQAGAPYRMAPYGTEALAVMRIEKGHIAGNEIDGRTTARDLGLGRLMSSKKDFVGRTMAERPGLLDPDRPSLVGIKPVRSQDRLRAGAHLLPSSAAVNAASDQGIVTSVAFSPSLKHWIGLGLLARGPQRLGERVRAADPVRGHSPEVEICAPCFIDPEGKRVHG
jgi:methylglutamate dehydrogenase subunit C